MTFTLHRMLLSCVLVSVRRPQCYAIVVKHAELVCNSAPPPLNDGQPTCSLSLSHAAPGSRTKVLAGMSCSHTTALLSIVNCKVELWEKWNLC